jgi:hypothetical protein
MLLTYSGRSATTTADEEVSLMASAMGCGNGLGQKPTSVLSHLAAEETRRSSAALTLDPKRACSPALAIRANRQNGDRRIETLSK